MAQKIKNYLIIGSIVLIIFLISIFIFSSDDTPKDSYENIEKEIYWQLVTLQDKIPLNDEQYDKKIKASEEIVAEYYNLTLDELNEIIYRGNIELWPIPKI
jgi:hypothetical protein